jgi:hypothetical protein
MTGSQKEIELFSEMGISRLRLGPKPSINTYSTLTTTDSSSNETKTLEYSSLNNLFKCDTQNNP